MFEAGTPHQCGIYINNTISMLPLLAFFSCPHIDHSETSLRFSFNYSMIVEVLQHDSVRNNYTVHWYILFNAIIIFQQSYVCSIRVTALLEYIKLSIKYNTESDQ